MENYYIFGKNTINTLLNNDKNRITRIFSTQNFSYGNIPVEIVDKNFFNKKFDGQNHQNIAALVSKEKIDIEKILNKDQCIIILLDQVTDPMNVGNIFRSACGFNVDLIVATNDNTPKNYSTISKVACGGFEIVPFLKVPNLKNFIKEIKNKGFWVYGMDAASGNNVFSEKFEKKSALILGNEHKGMRKHTKDNCDIFVNIPMNKNFDSLNVASSCAITLAKVFNDRV